MNKDTKNEALILRAAESAAYAELLADQIEKQGLMTAPANLKSSILARSRQIDVQVTAKSNLLSRKLELLIYSLKVSAAAACSVALILAVPARGLAPSPAELRPPLSIHQKAAQSVRHFEKQIEEALRGISEQLPNTEVPFHD